MDEQQMKYIYYTVLSAFFVVLIIVIVYAVFWGPIKSYSDSLFPVRTTNVSAQGKAVVQPDIATFSFSVVTEGANPRKIADDNNTIMQKAIDAVKARGIDEKDIKTTDYNLSPRYNYDRQTGKSYIYGYQLTQTAAVKVRNLKDNLPKVPEILGALPNLGINQISSVSFSVDDPDQYLGDARNQAFEKARAKAQAMAEANGLKLGRILSVSEFSGSQPAPYYDKTLGMGGGAGAAMSVAPSIEPGSQEITVSVSLTYELK